MHLIRQRWIVLEDRDDVRPGAGENALRIYMTHHPEPQGRAQQPDAQRMRGQRHACVLRDAEMAPQ